LVADVSVKSVQCAVYQRQAENAILIHRTRESDTVSRESRETNARVVWLVPHQNNGTVAKAFGLVDATLHQSNADAAVPLIGLDR